MRDSLNDEASAALLDRLLLRLVQLVAAEEGALVKRKLCSALVTYLLCPSVSWDYCVKHILCCFYANTVIPVRTIDQYPLTSEMVQRLSAAQLLTSLWFVTTLVEEVGKTSSESIQTYAFVSRVPAT